MRGVVRVAWRFDPEARDIRGTVVGEEPATVENLTIELVERKPYEMPCCDIFFLPSSPQRRHEDAADAATAGPGSPGGCT